MERRVRAIPLAQHGFIPRSERNPVRWYLEDADTDRLIDLWSMGYATRELAEHDARAIGYTVED